MNPLPSSQRPPVAEPTVEDLGSLDLSPPDSQALVRHPDGFYWLGADGRMQIGPYATDEEALAEMNRAGEEGLGPDD